MDQLQTPGTENSGRKNTILELVAKPHKHFFNIAMTDASCKEGREHIDIILVYDNDSPACRAEGRELESRRSSCCSGRFGAVI